MPSWIIHLEIAKRVNKVLKLNKELFLYGNLIPDVDKGTSISRYEAHYYNEKLPFPTVPQEKMIDMNKFLDIYKKQLTNHLVLGYYSHLLTDQFYNERIYTTKWVQDSSNNIVGIKFNNGKILKIDVVDKKRYKRKYKHLDLELYGKYLFDEIKIDVPSDIGLIEDNIKYLYNNFLTKELVEKRINYLNNDFLRFNKLSIKEKIFRHKYRMFTKEELDNMLDECSNMVVKKLKEFL